MFQIQNMNLQKLAEPRLKIKQHINFGRVNFFVLEKFRLLRGKLDHRTSRIESSSSLKFDSTPELFTVRFSFNTDIQSQGSDVYRLK